MVRDAIDMIECHAQFFAETGKNGMATQLRESLAELKTERARMQKALLEIENGTILQFEESEEREVEVWMDAEDMQKIARQALNPASTQTKPLMEDQQ